MNAGLANFRWGCGVEVRGTCAWCGSLGDGWWAIELTDAVYGQVNVGILRVMCICIYYFYTPVLDLAEKSLISDPAVAWQCHEARHM